jgi:hypothetical protein
VSGDAYWTEPDGIETPRITLDTHRRREDLARFVNNSGYILRDGKLTWHDGTMRPEWTLTREPVKWEFTREEVQAAQLGFAPLGFAFAVVKPYMHGYAAYKCAVAAACALQLVTP